MLIKEQPTSYNVKNVNRPSIILIVSEKEFSAGYSRHLLASISMYLNVPRRQNIVGVTTQQLQKKNHACLGNYIYTFTRNKKINVILMLPFHFHKLFWSLFLHQQPEPLIIFTTITQNKFKHVRRDFNCNKLTVMFQDFTMA